MAVDAEGAAARTPWRARVGLVALFALFLLPVVGAFVLHLAAPGWVPFGYVNHGELVHPPVPAGLGEVRFVDGAPPPAEGAEAVWILVHAGDAPCGDACVTALSAMHRARLALGKDAHRVARWWLVTREPDARSVARLRRADPGVRIAIAGGASPLLPGSGDGAPVQIVDPAGYVILRYRDPDPASPMLKDLKRLLKISRQG